MDEPIIRPFIFRTNTVIPCVWISAMEGKTNEACLQF